MAANFTVVLENWDGECKRGNVQADSAEEAYGVAFVQYPDWACVEVIENEEPGQ
jgi:hypothetical protein